MSKILQFYLSQNDSALNFPTSFWGTHFVPVGGSSWCCRFSPASMVPDRWLLWKDWESSPVLYPLSVIWLFASDPHFTLAPKRVDCHPLLASFDLLCSLPMRGASCGLHRKSCDFLFSQISLEIWRFQVGLAMEMHWLEDKRFGYIFLTSSLLKHYISQ